MAVGPIVCRDQRFISAGDGRAEDYWLANSRFRAVIRHPNASLGLAGVGGGTLVDAAPWGRADFVYEIAPLIDGAWLDVDDIHLDPDGIRLTGTRRPLPDRPDVPVDETVHEVTWRVRPDDPWLYIEGADGFWVHPSSEMQLVDGWLYGSPVVIGHNGVIEEDLGGALRIRDADALLFSEHGDAWSQRPGPHRLVQGTAPQATEVRLFRDETWVGSIPVDSEGGFSATVPATVTTLRATAPGRAPSPPEVADEGVLLSVGALGGLDIRYSWPGGRPRRVSASWTDGDLRAGRSLLPPAGGPLMLGAGVFDITLTAGPAFRTRTLRVEVPEDALTPVLTVMEPIIATERHVLATSAWQGARSRHVRASARDRLRAASARGFEYVISTAEDDIDSVEAYLDDVAWIRWTQGARLTHGSGWSVSGWPWRANDKRSGHGVPMIGAWTPEASLQGAWGGDATDRHVQVDLAWLQTAQTAPHGIHPAPSHLSLPSPTFPPHRAWSLWYDWLDASRFLLPAGPSHWLDVEDPSRYGPTDLRSALTTGRFCTGTGAWLDMTVDDVGPGELLSPPESATGDVSSTSGTDSATGSDQSSSETDTAETDTTDDTAVHAPTEHLVRLRLQPGETSVRHVSIVTTGGVVLETLTADSADWSWEGTLELGHWVIAIGWSDDTQDWVVTAPTWTAPPADPPRDTAEPIDPPQDAP